MKVFILLSFVAVALATRECGENSHYDSCGTACPLTCKNYNNPPKACVLMCNPGCHCDKGYIKTDDGRCVAPEECPAQTDVSSSNCGENAHFESCGTACPLTCRNYLNPPKFCVKMCKIGCQCDKGYVKTDDGRCVSPEECPAETEEVCGENQAWTTCGTACPLTCDNYQNPPKFCTLQCVIGCACTEGFVKTRDGRCVRPQECPASAPEEKTCLGEADGGYCRGYFRMWYYDGETKQCKQFTYGGCGGNGNRYNSEEECMEKCGEVCEENQVWNTCGTACPLTCDNYQNPPKVCTLQCVIGCACAKGFVKTRDGRCVTPQECPASTPEEKTCLGDADGGYCRGYFPMWYYDGETKQCKQFVYGGCGGNGNRYSSEEECMEKCGDVLNESTANICELPREPGPCRAGFPRYYFNKETRKCEKFLYGGCQGNSNNFKTSEECEQTCAA